MSDKYYKRKLKSSSLTTVVSISLVLFMLGLLGLIILNTKKLSDHVKENIGFQVYLNDNAKDEEVEKLRKKISTASYIKSSQFVTKEEGAETLKNDLGEDFISFLGQNPIPATINVNLKADYANNDSIAKIEGNLLKERAVKEVVYQKSLVSMVNQNAKKIGLVILAFSALLMTVALALINNTIRLSIYSKRFLIKTMQLVGATQGFIRKPFLLKGIQHGIFAALIAIVLLLGVMYLAQRQLPEIIELQDAKMILTLFGIVFLLGILISGISTILAVRKYLKLKADELYY